MESTSAERRPGIALASLTVMGGYLASKVIGVVRQSIIARTFTH